MKKCTKCFKSKSEDLFWKLTTKYGVSLHARCADCMNKDQKRRYKSNPELGRRCSLRRARELKTQVIAGYGSKCVCCGELNPAFLCIDHVNNDGHILRKKEKHMHSGTNLYRKLVNEGFPKEFQLMCYNCNMGKAYNGGMCPHKSEVSIVYL